MTCSTCFLPFGTSAKQQREINSKFYGERRQGCVFSFLYLNLSMVVIDTLKLIFPCDVFFGVSDRIQCHFFLPGRRQRLMSLLISLHKTAGYHLDDCFASCENIVWISFKRMYGKLLPPRLVQMFAKILAAKTQEQLNLSWL